MKSDQAHRKRLVLGDIVEVKVGRKYAYAQFVVEHKRPPFFGKVMRILPGLFNKPQCTFDILSIQEGSYCCFWWVNSGIRLGKVKIVGHSTIPRDFRKMPIFKWGIRNLKTRRISKWNIWDGKRTSSTPVKSLSEAQREYPIREIVPTDVVIERIKNGWHPRQECQ